MDISIQSGNMSDSKVLNPLEKLLLKIEIWKAQRRIAAVKRERARKNFEIEPDKKRAPKQRGT